ncbi:methyltransferase [Catellatospora sp. TT07R-123]|uniref:class I SAM-dependent methyltransferase n=1 Tax=Catellatospora sp. TT07R-123 TaxID=2733863 RepID=UPI001B0ADFBF|nr:class I SAM-dependent methyltransferase [Catellatospora sp. TT07R-123]GHJ43680.1 methyltransferase [Catellatospora sp. TT07R-123]
MRYAAPATLFAGTEEDYSTYRPPHPAVFVNHVAGLHPGGAVLDLGTGPGSLALGLATRDRHVVGIDASPKMIEIARNRAAEEGFGDEVEFRVGDVHELIGLPKVAGVVIGDAFHWFDRASVVRQLDELVVPGGFVAIMMSFAAGSAKPWWYPLADRVIHRHLGIVRRAGPDALHHEQPGGDHETVLRSSAFNALTVMRTDVRLSMSLDQVMGLQYTQAYSSPAVLGDRLAEFDADLRRLLLAAEPGGMFTATIQPAMIIARRGED